MKNRSIQNIYPEHPDKVLINTLTAMETVDFSNTRKAFSLKNNKQLKFSYWLFRLMGNPSLVKFFSKMTLFSIKLGLPVRPLIKSTIFKQFCGGESLAESEKVITQLDKVHVGAILDYSIEGKEREEDFESTKNELLKVVQLARSNKAVPYTSMKITGIVRSDLLSRKSAKAVLTQEEEKEWNLFLNRFDEICSSCHDSEVPIYIDAEESWLQGAIDEVTEEMMRKYNKGKAIVQTTLQMYRWDRLSYLKKLIEWAGRENIFIGVKLVRGAYWEKENRHADESKVLSPVHQLKSDTDADFDLAVDLCLENINCVTLCAGTHNEASTMHLIHHMKELGIANGDTRVYCSQLFGMSDHITYNLAEAGYNVTKYLPYGPVQSVIPYLIRRAEENTSIGGQMSRELKLITVEKDRRKDQLLLH
ncbi:MAG: proline dehydrogenase family protein [Bacteroidia bacterium]